MKHLKSFKVFENEEDLPRLKRLLELGMITDEEYFDGVIERSANKYSRASIEGEFDLYWVLQNTSEETKSILIDYLRENNLSRTDILVDLATIWVDEWTEEDAEYMRTLDMPNVGIKFGFDIAYSTNINEVEDWAYDKVDRIALDFDIHFEDTDHNR